MPATFGRRRQTQTKLGKPVGRAVALAKPYAIRVYRIIAGDRSDLRRPPLFGPHSALRPPIRAGPVIIFPRAVRAYLRIANRGQSRLRGIRSRLRRPIGRAVALLKPYPIRVIRVMAGDRSDLRRRPVRPSPLSKLRP